MHSFIVIDYFNLKLEIGLKVKWTKKLTFFLFSFYLYPANIKSKHPKWDLGKDFLSNPSSYEDFWMTKTIDIDVLGSGEPYQFEPPVLEEESYASNNSFNGLKHERMIHFLYTWLLWKRPYIIEMNTFGNSLRKFCDLLSFPHAVSLFGFCCVRAHVELRFKCECKCRMILLFRGIILRVSQWPILIFAGIICYCISYLLGRFKGFTLL